MTRLIFCCGMPRSGGTLLYQLTKEIAEFGGICKGRGFPKERYQSGVVKTDTCQPWMIERVKSGEAIAFGTIRDFRDIVVSLVGFYNRRALARGPKRTWTVDDVLKYRANILDIHYCWQPWATWFQYESPYLSQSIVDEVSKILGVSLDSGQKGYILVRNSLKANEERIKRQKAWMDAGPGSMLTKIHISPTRGKSTWRKVLSKSDLEKIMAIGGDWLRENGYI